MSCQSVHSTQNSALGEREERGTSKNSHAGLKGVSDRDSAKSARQPHRRRLCACSRANKEIEFPSSRRQAEPINSAHLETAVLLQWTGKGGYCLGDTSKPEVVVLVATLTSPGVSCLNLMHEVTTEHLKQGGKVLGGMPSSESTP